MRARLKGPSKMSKTMDANLDFAFVENAFVLVVSKIWQGLMGWALLGSPLLEPGGMGKLDPRELIKLDSRKWIKLDHFFPKS